MSKAMKEFLKKIQTSDERIKRRWLFLFSGISMLAVVFLWTKYFNSIVGPINAPEQKNEEVSQSFPFWGTFRAGLGVVSETAGGIVHSALSIISQPKNYDIKP